MEKGTREFELEEQKPAPVADNDDSVRSVEGNVVGALFVLITGVVLDALCMLPGAILADVPASLRTTSLVLVVLLGAPSISQTRAYVLEQRAILCLLLATSAFIGLNRAEPTARNADAMFAMVGTLAAVVACATNGAVQTDDLDVRKGSREHMSALFAALLFYLGIRCVRNAFSLPGDILGFSVSRDEFDVRGYGVANELTATGLAFAGAVIAAFGVIILLNHDMVTHTGSQGLSTVAGVLACCAFVGAFATQISTYALMENLPALFTEAACDGSYDECSAAYRARRLFVASNNSSVAWIGVISITVYGFTNVRLFVTRRQHFEYTPDLYGSANITSLVALVVSTFVVFWFLDTSRPMNFSDIELVLLLLSIPTAIFGWSITACTLHLAGQVIYVVTRITSPYGFLWTYFTHHSIIGTLVLTALTLLCCSSSYALYNFGGARLYAESVEWLNGIFLTALVSVQLFLTIGTMTMSSGYTGIRYEDDKGSWRLSGYEFSVQHSISFFFCAALYATRWEHAMLTATQRRVAWFALPPLLGMTWLMCITILSHEGSPYNQWVDLGSFFVGMTSAVISWFGVGLFLHR